LQKSKINEKSIQDIQNEIIEEFAILGDDKESTIYYIMELGDQLPQFPEEERKDENIIKGCQSKVWLDNPRRRWESEVFGRFQH
jgi:sulfur transfer protein SufE